jgi:uncharacterized protein YeaO (DUF488 family)
VLKTKSVHSPIEPELDGLRILATRLRGRGLPSSRYDVWMASLGPSEQLLRRIQAGKIGWPAFRREYLKELTLSDAIDRRNRLIKNHGQKFPLRLIKHLAAAGNVTLLCHCAEDTRQCHRHELRHYILSNKV